MRALFLLLPLLILSCAPPKGGPTQAVEKPKTKAKKESVKPVKTEKEKKKVLKLSQIPQKALETARLAVLKESAQIQREGNTVYEAIPKKLKNGCYSILVKVKDLNKKTEKDYTLQFCNGKFKLK